MRNTLGFRETGITLHCFGEAANDQSSRLGSTHLPARPVAVSRKGSSSPLATFQIVGL
jgi:hypothetical protein